MNHLNLTKLCPYSIPWQLHNQHCNCITLMGSEINESRFNVCNLFPTKNKILIYPTNSIQSPLHNDRPTLSVCVFSSYFATSAIAIIYLGRPNDRSDTRLLQYTKKKHFQWLFLLSFSRHSSLPLCYFNKTQPNPKHIPIIWF